MSDQKDYHTAVGSQSDPRFADVMLKRRHGSPAGTV